MKMNRRWPLRGKRKGISGISGIPGSLFAVGLLLGVLYAFIEDFRTHPLAPWTPLLILVILVPGVALSIRSELKAGKEKGTFIKREGRLFFEGSLFKSRIVRVDELQELEDGYLLIFTDAQDRRRELRIDRQTEDLVTLLQELETLR